MARKPWTPEEDNRLRMLLGAGKPIEFVDFCNSICHNQKWPTYLFNLFMVR